MTRCQPINGGIKMPSTTFLNLNEDKRKKVVQSLLLEFSNHSVSDAQVARIVKEAGIARGAFYKYFNDLQDAYAYLYQQAMVEIHKKITNSSQILSAEEYRKQIKDFLDAVNGSPYQDLILLHFQVNESLVKPSHTKAPQPKDSREWGVMVLSHEAIKESLQTPEKEKQIIERCYEAIRLLTQKA